MKLPITIKLKKPVSVDGTTYDELTFDEPDLGTSIAVEEAEKATDQTVILLAGMAGVDREVVLKIKERDVETIMRDVMTPYQDGVAAARGGAVGNESPAA
jgi:hypothetical protein